MLKMMVPLLSQRSFHILIMSKISKRLTLEDSVLDILPMRFSKSKRLKSHQESILLMSKLKELQLMEQ